MIALAIPRRVKWFVKGAAEEDDPKLRRKHALVVKCSVSVAVMGAIFLPNAMSHLAAPVAVMANMLWIWIDP